MCLVAALVITSAFTYRKIDQLVGVVDTTAGEVDSGAARSIAPSDFRRGQVAALAAAARDARTIQQLILVLTGFGLAGIVVAALALFGTPWRRPASGAIERGRHAAHEDEFLAIVSHELRTPLNAIVGWVHLLRLGVLDARDARRAIEAIERNANVQTRAVDDLLDASRMIQGELTLAMARCDLRSIVREVASRFEPSLADRHLTLELRLDEDEVPIDGDVARLQQMVWNLLANAVKFTATEGRIVVDVHRTERRAVLRVADDGEGIEPTFLPHVFEPFRQGATRTVRAGLGLGLAIVREVAELHGGSIVAESSGRGRGAAFTVTLPLAQGTFQGAGRALARRFLSRGVGRHRR